MNRRQSICPLPHNRSERDAAAPSHSTTQFPITATISGLMAGGVQAVHLLRSTGNGRADGFTPQVALHSLALRCQEGAGQRPTADEGVSRWC